MKERTNALFVSMNLMKNKNYFEEAQKKFKYCIFALFFLLLKNQDLNFWLEIIGIIFQLLQLLPYPFSPLFSNIWKQETAFTDISTILRYFQIVYFFESNKEMYYIAFYLFTLILLITLIFIIFITVKLHHNESVPMWYVQLSKALIPFITNWFFLPFLNIFLSLLSCSNGNNLYISNLKCWKGFYFIHSSIGIIMSVILIIIAIFSQSTYFETKLGTHNPMAKSTSRPDLFILYTKIILVILFTIVGESNSKTIQWILIIILLFLSAYIFFLFRQFHPYYFKPTMQIYYCISLLFLWSCVVLFFGKILENTAFNGLLGLFIVGIPIILVFILTKRDEVVESISLIGAHGKAWEELANIHYVLLLIDNKETDRNAKIILNGYIDHYEETCNVKDCPLRKYVNSLKNTNSDSVVFLLQHLENLFQSAISKHPQCTTIRIAYAFFLTERLNKKQQAAMELKNTEKEHPNYEEEFIIYRYKRLLEEQSNDLNESEDNLDMVSTIEYKNYFLQFKNSIIKVTSLYLDFWSLLMNPNKDSQEDLAKLNDYGTKINILVEEIHNTFEKIQKIKHNDQDTIRYYADFLYDILNEKEKAQKYKSKIIEVEDVKETNDEMNIMNLIDANIIKSNTEYQYIFVSGQLEEIGTIINLSLGVCSMFGFTKNELLGKSIDIIMPEILHNEHRELMKEKLNEFKKIAIDLFDIKAYKPTFKDIVTFGRNKSRYLVPISIKVALVPTDNNDVVFAAKIWHDNRIVNNTDHTTCFILTNNLLIIQNFTPNAVNLLGMNSCAMNNCVEITDYIKQFNEESIGILIENEDKSPEQKIMFKRQILRSKFRTPMLINWKRFDRNELKLKSTKIIDLNSLNAERTETRKDSEKQIKFSGIPKQSYDNENLVLTVSDVIIKSKQEGYIFKFEKGPISRNSAFCPSPKYDKKDKGSGKRENIVNVTTKIKKKESLGTTISGTQQFNLIDQYYVPISNFSFALDPKELSFKPSQGKGEELKRFLKQEAYKKIETQIIKGIKEKRKKNKDEEEEEEEEEDEEDKEEDESDSGSGSRNKKESSSSNSSSNKKKKAMNISKDKGENKELREEMEKIRQKEDKYYKVNISKIKYCCYDYHKKMVLEVKWWDRRDQVEQRINDDYKKKENEPTTSSGDPSILKQSDIMNKEGGIKLDGQNDNNNSQENLLIKQIEYGLEKEENQPSITRLRWTSLLFFVSLLGMCSGLLSFLILQYQDIFENVIIINKVYYLIILNSLGIYFTRELTLLNNTYYVKIPSEREIYIQETFNYTLQIFIESHDVITYIFTSFLELSKENAAKLTNTQITIRIIEDDYSVSKFNLSLNSAFIEANTALFHVGHESIANIIPTNKDVFFYVFNSINDIANGLDILTEVYLDELNINIMNVKIRFIIILCCYTIGLLIISIGISFAYDAVTKRKESYLEIFFEIGNNVIRASLEKCENFTKKIQSDTINDTLSLCDDGDIEQEKIVVKKDSLNDGGHRKKKTNASKETKIFKLKLAVLLFIILVFYFLIFTFFWLFLNGLKVYMTFFDKSIELENMYLTLFNALREYMIEPNNDFREINVLNFLNEQFEKFYIDQVGNLDYINEHINKMPKEYKNMYIKLNLDVACDENAQYFNSSKQCEKFMSNATSYGFKVLMSFFYEELRNMKRMTDKANNEMNSYPTPEAPFTYNCTLFGTDDFLKNFPPKDNAEHYDFYINHLRMNTFNRDNKHLDLNIMFIHIIIPKYESLRKKMKICIEDAMKIFKVIFVIVIAIFMGILLFVYLFIWVPFERNLNQIIYKTKNMLTIIPKEVLASLKNIQKLLDIGQNPTKNQKIQGQQMQIG